MATGYSNSRKSKLTSLEPLRFGRDGKFKILHLTDIHKVHPDMDDELDRSIPEGKSKGTLYNIEKSIELTKPDLVVFGGDNVSGHWDEMTDEYALWSINSIIASVSRFNIPLAVVFGNHDEQNKAIAPLLTKEVQMSIYMNYDNFRGCYNEADVYGCGTYHLNILACDSDDVLWNVWCFDSNDYIRNPDYSLISYDYDSVHQDQLDWYRETVKAEKDKYGKIVPAVLFQHIPVNQENDFIEESDEAHCDYESGGRYFAAKPGAIKEGKLLESPCPPMNNRSEFEAWKECGDIKAAFFGHDHKNTFRFDKDGIALYQTVSCGYECYGDEKGGRLITLLENGEYTTETIVINK